MNVVERFVTRLKSIGITVELISNAPWIYLHKVNGVKVTEHYMGNHGFTAFWYPIQDNQDFIFTERKEVFNLIRRYVSDEV